LQRAAWARLRTQSEFIGLRKIAEVHAVRKRHIAGRKLRVKATLRSGPKGPEDLRGDSRASSISLANPPLRRPSTRDRHPTRRRLTRDRRDAFLAPPDADRWPFVHRPSAGAGGSSALLALLVPATARTPQRSRSRVDRQPHRRIRPGQAGSEGTQAE